MQRDDDRKPAFGSALIEYRKQNAVLAASARTAQQRVLAVTHVWTDGSVVERTQPMPPEDAFHLVLQLANLPSHELWTDGRLIQAAYYPRRSLSILDLRRAPQTRIASAHEALVFYVPRSALNEIAAEYESQPIEHLSLEPGVPRVDPVMNRFGEVLRPASGEAVLCTQLAIDQFMLVMNTYVAQTYGELRRRRATALKGLAPWQERRAKEMMSAPFAHHLSLADLARACSLSVSHFTRSFRQSTGVSPHRWLMQQRVYQAKELLDHGSLSIVQIAATCGFADQSSFTKAFTRSEGVAPGTWRRMRQ